MAIDPLGHCPAGHLLPANGVRISSAIGSHEPYPDEPVPWVGQVELDAPAPAPSGVEERSAQPHAAPGLAPAERDTLPGDLLRELGALSSDEPDPAPVRSQSPATNGHAPAANGHPGHAPAGDTHAGQAPGTAPGTPPGPTAASTNGNGHHAGADVSELSALEQAIQSLDGAGPTGAPAPDHAAAPAVDDDFSRLFADLEGLGEDDAPSPAPGAPASTSTPPPPPPPATSAPTHAEPTPTYAEPTSTNADAEPAPQPARASIDTMNFTAKGGPVGNGRRRKLFGR